MLFLIAYIGSVVLINYAFSTAPHLDIIWSAWGGLVFILRDMVQTRFGHGALVAMLAALVLSYIPPILLSPWPAPRRSRYPSASTGWYSASPNAHCTTACG